MEEDICTNMADAVVAALGSADDGPPDERERACVWLKLCVCGRRGSVWYHASQPSQALRNMASFFN